MAIAQVYTRALVGIDAPEVRVEVHIAGGLPSFAVVGLPEASVREARERVRAALQNSGFEFPARRITVNLAPADLPKQGGRFDLGIALAILTATGQLPPHCIQNREFYGELSLAGEIQGSSGLLPAALACQQASRQMVVANNDAQQLQLIHDLNAISASTLPEMIELLLGHQGEGRLPVIEATSAAPAAQDLSDVIGQHQGKQALMIAAAGQHNLMLVGPPGTGKTMLASRLSDLLPELSMSQALEVASIHSIASLDRHPVQLTQRPFRAPHHSSSSASLVGGGSVPKPGEISLAHHGVLFLDELPEFPRTVLDSLREPLESGQVVISRAAAKLKFPAEFQLIAALNPSPCGEIGAQSRSTPEQIRRYLSRISGPFLDRFDLSVDVNRLPPGQLNQPVTNPLTTAVAKDKVAQARRWALSRQNCLNSQLSSSKLNQNVGISREVMLFAEESIQRLKLSIRAYHRILKVSRTIADLAQSQQVETSHVAQALSYRAMDKLLAQLM